MNEMPVTTNCPFVKGARLFFHAEDGFVWNVRFVKFQADGTALVNCRELGAKCMEVPAAALDHEFRSHHSRDYWAARGVGVMA